MVTAPLAFGAAEAPRRPCGSVQRHKGWVVFLHSQIGIQAQLGQDFLVRLWPELPPGVNVFTLKVGGGRVPRKGLPCPSMRVENNNRVGRPTASAQAAYWSREHRARECRGVEEF